MGYYHFAHSIVLQLSSDTIWILFSMCTSIRSLSLAVILVVPLLAHAQWTLPASGCNIRYSYDAAGNRTSRYWYCWTGLTEAPTTELSADQPSVPGTSASSTSVPDQPLRALELQVYPNPAHRELNIALSGAVSGAVFNVYDAQGQNVLSGRITGSSQQMDTSSLRPGMYHLCILREQEQLIAAFVVE